MPTSRHRYTITETDSVTLALDEAARQFPDERDAPSRLLLRLVEAGHAALRERREETAEADRATIERMSGLLTGAYPPGYLEKLREDWPA